MPTSSTVPLPWLGLSAHACAAPVAGAADVPATPSAEQARQAARDELSRRAYQDRTSLLDAVWHWIAQHLDPRGLLPGAPAWVSYLVVGLALAGLATAAVVLARHARTRSRVRRRQSLFDDDRDWRALARAADEAASRQEWASAVVERFRAIIRRLDEHGIVTDYPGMTAREAGEGAARALPELAGRLRQGAAVFDSVRYGRVRASRRQDAWMRALDDAVARLLPTAHAAGPPRQHTGAPEAAVTGREELTTP